MKSKVKAITNSTEEDWSNIKDEVLEAAEESLGYKCMKNKK
jgi:hypothetical protein